LESTERGASVACYCLKCSRFHDYDHSISFALHSVEVACIALGFIVLVVLINIVLIVFAVFSFYVSLLISLGLSLIPMG